MMLNNAMSFAKNYTPNSLYPAYKRKVDNIYPRNADQGLNHVEMQCLRNARVFHRLDIYVKAAAQLAVIPHLNVNTLIQAEFDEI